MILCLQAANGPISMQHRVSRFDKIKSRLYMIMSGPDEWLPLGVHCDGVSEFFFLRAYKRPVSDSLPVYVPLSSSCVCDDREQHVIFFLFQPRSKHFYGLINKTAQQSMKTASFSVLSLPLSLVVVGPLLFYELWLPVLHLFVYISVFVCRCQ